MALTQLVDVIIPEVYESYSAVNSPELTAFYTSGIAVTDAAIGGAFSSGGKTVHLPFWKDLDATVEPNYSTDDPTQLSTPDKVTAGEQLARIAQMNKSFSAADLTGELAGSDPMRRIRDRFGSYWTKQWQRRILATCKGVLAHNIASEGSDMVNNVAVEDQNLVTAANLFGRLIFTGAVFTLGDHFDMVTAIAVHSFVYKRMVDNDDIEFEKPSVPDPNLPLDAKVPYFMGKRVIVDDSMPIVANTSANGFKFTSVLFGPGAIGYAESTKGPYVPVEVYRRPDKGNGGGVEELYERKSWIIHPFGYQFTSTTVAGQSATYAELATANNWSRVIERKNVPLAFVISNG